MNAIERAKRAVGGTGFLARQLSAVGKTITPQAISQWRIIPAARARDVETVTGIPRNELRPDLWDKPE